MQIVRKKNIAVLVLALVLCLVSVAPAHAQGKDEGLPKASVTLSCNLVNATGGKHKIWGRLTTINAAELRIYVYLYAKGSSTVLASCSSLDTGTRVYATKTVALSPGTYLVKAYGYVNDASYYSQVEINIS